VDQTLRYAHDFDMASKRTLHFSDCTNNCWTVRLGWSISNRQERIDDVLSCCIGLISKGAKQVNNVNYPIQSHTKFIIVFITNDVLYYLKKKISLFRFFMISISVRVLISIFVSFHRYLEISFQPIDDKDLKMPASFSGYFSTFSVIIHDI